MALDDLHPTCSWCKGRICSLVLSCKICFGLEGEARNVWTSSLLQSTRREKHMDRRPWTKRRQLSLLFLLFFAFCSFFSFCISSCLFLHGGIFSPVCFVFDTLDHRGSDLARSWGSWCYICTCVDPYVFTCMQKYFGKFWGLGPTRSWYVQLSLEILGGLRLAALLDQGWVSLGSLGFCPFCGGWCLAYRVPWVSVFRWGGCNRLQQ